MTTPPPDANQNCPGPDNENAGKLDSCAGCPNQKQCQEGPTVDPAIEIINEKMKSVKQKILVLSGKGGVGKSTVSTNLAFCMGLDDSKSIGLMDLDICGPSLPKMTGLEGEQIHVVSTE